MRLKFELRGDVLRVDIQGRETAEETREIAEKTFAERERHGALAIAMVIRESRPIFKVEEYGLSAIFARLSAVPGLRLAAVAEDGALHSAHEYIEVLARQRGVAYRAFRSEAAAMEWLQGPR